MTSSGSNEWNAGVYHRVANPHVSWGRGLLESLDLRGNETVVDAGCGTGRITEQLLQRLPEGHVIAVDRSANMIQTAKANLDSRFPGRVTFVQVDLLDIDVSLTGGQADLVFSTATFHWIRDHVRLFRRLYDLLRPGGLLLAQCGGGPNLQRHVDRAEALMRSPMIHTHFSNWRAPSFTVDEVATNQRLRGAGFVDVATSVHEASTTLPNADECETYLANVVFREHLDALPEESLRREFIARLTEQSAADDPPFLLDYWRLNLQGRRPEDG